MMSQPIAILPAAAPPATNKLLVSQHHQKVHWRCLSAAAEPACVHVCVCLGGGGMEGVCVHAAIANENKNSQKVIQKCFQWWLVQSAGFSCFD